MHAPTHAVSQQRSRRAQEHWRREHTQPADPHVCVGDSSADEALCAIYSARMPPHPYRFREEEKGTENFRAHQSYAWLKLLRPVRESADPCTLRVFFSVLTRALGFHPPVVPLEQRLLRNREGWSKNIVVEWVWPLHITKPALARTSLDPRHSTNLEDTRLRFQWSPPHPVPTQLSEGPRAPQSAKWPSAARWTP